ncbi:MAG: hypothetical protein AAF799_21205 [Myxococcota bacterium]
MGRLKIVALVFVVLYCVAWAVLSTVEPWAPTGETNVKPPARISDEGRALLGGLAVGEKITGWTVRRLDGPRDSQLRVDVERDGVAFALMVALEGRLPQTPLVRTKNYVVFYGHPEPKDTVLPEGTIRATTNALARRIREHEADVEVPGL